MPQGHPFISFTPLGCALVHKNSRGMYQTPYPSVEVIVISQYSNMKLNEYGIFEYSKKGHSLDTLTPTKGPDGQRDGDGEVAEGGGGDWGVAAGQGGGRHGEGEVNCDYLSW